MDKVINTAIGASIVFTGTTYLISPKLAASFLSLQLASVGGVVGAWAGVHINAAWTDWLANHMPAGGGNGTPQLGVYLIMLFGGGVVSAFVGGIAGFGGTLYVLNQMMTE